MRQRPKFIGTIPTSEAEKTIGEVIWTPVSFDQIPYSAINPPPSYLFAVGSGCYPSMATTSAYGLSYSSGLDIVRQDYLSGAIVFDVDHYVAAPQGDFYAVFMELPPPYHHLTLQDQLLDYAAPEWQSYIRHNLGKKIF